MWRIKLFFRKLKRLVEWLPVIWRGDDYDYNFAINAFKYQLERTAKYIEKNGHLENGKQVVLQIRTATELIDKVYNDGYLDEAEAQFGRQYGTSEIVFTDYDGDNFEINIQWHSALNFEHNDEINEFYKAHMMHAYNKTKRGQDLLWRYIARNIDRWWD